MCPFDLRESKIATSARLVSGVTGEQLWLKINEPTEKDKGKYAMDIFDGKDGVKRVFELSGQGEWDLFHGLERVIQNPNTEALDSTMGPQVTLSMCSSPLPSQRT